MRKKKKLKKLMNRFTMMKGRCNTQYDLCFGASGFLDTKEAYA